MNSELRNPAPLITITLGESNISILILLVRDALHLAHRGTEEHETLVHLQFVLTENLRRQKL